MIGIIENNDDPLRQGRLQVRVYGLFDQKDENGEYSITTDLLPWARPGSMQNNIISIPKIGEEVEINFPNNIYGPVWTNLVYISPAVKSEISNDAYTTSNIIIYNDNLAGDAKSDPNPNDHIKMFFTEKRGFVISYGNTQGVSVLEMNPDGTLNISDSYGNSIAMNSDGISINCEKLTLNAEKVVISETASDKIIKGKLFKQFFDSHVHMTQRGPTEAPTVKMPESCLNKNVEV